MKPKLWEHICSANGYAHIAMISDECASCGKQRPAPDDCRTNEAKIAPPVGDDHEALTFHAISASAGVKFDQGKPPMSLLDRNAMEEIAKVLAFGAQKYQAHNWRKGIAYSRLLDAALRHLFAFADGEDLDHESGLSHIAHAGCCIVFLLGMIQSKPDMDDRHGVQQ